MADSFIEDSFIEDKLPPIPSAPTAAEVLSKMAVPSVPKVNSFSPSDIVKAAGETILPPGVAFRHGMPIGSGKAAVRALSPVAGQYGMSKVMEKAGSDVENAVIPAIDANVAKTKDAVTNPYAKAALAIPLAVGKVGVHLSAGALRPSSVQQQIGSEAAGTAALSGAGKLVKKGLTKYGKVAHSIDEGATEQAIKNTEVLDNDYATSERITSITNKLKTAVEDTRKTISKLYDSLKSKLDKANGGKGKVPFNKVTEPLNEANKKLKIGDSGIKKVDAAEEGRVKELNREFSEEINNKVMKDFVNTKGRIPNKADIKALNKALDEGKFTADDILSVRKRIDHEINYEGSTDFYKKEMLALRTKVDKAIRESYPALKKLDAATASVKKAEATLRRKTGIIPGKQLNEVNEEKVGRVARSLFSNDKQTLRKSMEEMGKKIGASNVVEEMKNVAASNSFNTGKEPLIQLFGTGINFRKIFKGGFKTGIKVLKSGKRVSTEAMPYVGSSLWKIGKKREK